METLKPTWSQSCTPLLLYSPFTLPMPLPVLQHLADTDNYDAKGIHRLHFELL